MKLDNVEFENTYKSVLKAEDSITSIMTKKGIEMEK
jgi:hypothetical protein